MTTNTSPILTFLEQHPEYNVTTLAITCGIGRTTLSRIAHGRQKPLFDTGDKITNVTGIDYRALLDFYNANQEG